MAGETLWINDVDCRELNLYTRPQIRGLLGATARPVSVTRLLGRPGGRIGRKGQHVERNVSIPSFFKASSIANLRAEWAVVQQELLQDEVRLRSAYAPDLEYFATWTNENAVTIALETEPEEEFNLEFVCPLPFGRHIDGPFAVDFDSAPVAIPSGLQACRGTIILRGGTDPIVYLCDADDNVLASMGFTVTHTGDQETRIESHIHRVILAEDDEDAGVSDRASLTSGEFIEVDPIKYRADVATGAFLKLKVSDGEGTFIYDKYS